VLCALAVAGGCGEEDANSTTEGSITSTSSGAEIEDPTVSTGAPTPAAREPDPPHGDPPEQNPEPRLSPTRVIEAVLTVSGDPRAACGELVTERFVRAAYGDRRGCLAARKPAALADSIEVVEIAMLERAGTSTVVPSGGPYDGIEIHVGFTSADGFGAPWQVSLLEADVPAGP